jgi:hypothetical protein
MNFLAAFFFLVVYLCTNSYIFAWDDQHLEIPLLKHLIDPTLYAGDYYVEGLAHNFSSFLYPILAKLITIDQIQPVYLVLFLISRFFMFYWIYRLWQLISGEKWAAAMAVLMFILMARTEEFLYRTFSHQEFCFIFMFAGIFYFYRERYFLAAVLFGIGANFNAIYNLFPMIYMLSYLMLFRKDRFSMTFKTAGLFVLAALPFLLWQIPRSIAQKVGGAPVPIEEWMPLYLIACQQNFLFWTSTLSQALKDIPFMLNRLEPYLYLLGVYTVLCVFDKKFRADRKAHIIVGVGYAFVFLSFYFSYIHPSRFVIDLNLLRNEQYVRFFLMGYATLFACRVTKEGKPWQALCIALFFFVVGFGEINNFNLRLVRYWYVPALIGICAIAVFIKPQLVWLRRILIVIPLLTSFISFSQYHVRYLHEKKNGGGFWQMYRNWVDMQKYVKEHTPKDALIMIPHNTDTGGFRIFSERKPLVCYRDCGIVGFDYNAAVEWNNRIKDIEEFKYLTRENIQRALFNGVMKYKVDYIVFMNYYQPQTENPLLTKIYQNEVLSLYKVNK